MPGGLGRGAYSGRYHKFVCRMWSLNPDEEIGRDFFRQPDNRGYTVRESVAQTKNLNALPIWSTQNGWPARPGCRPLRETVVVQFLSCGADTGGKHH